MSGGTDTARTLFGLEGRRVLVIGGGQGMGEATATLLASLGCAVAVMDLEVDRAAGVADAIGTAGGVAYPVAADVLDDAALIDAIDRTEREFGPLDGLATIVGMAGWASILDTSPELWDHDHRRNLRYVFIAAREVARRMIERQAGGSMAMVASVDGMRSARMHVSYGAAKAGLINMVRTMAVEWAPHNIRVNCVAPGATVTPRIPLKDRETERHSMERIPMQRRGFTDDIAKAAAFFLSDMTPYVTGQTLAVDGGYLAADLFNLSSAVKKGGTIGLDQEG
ncbi:MAG TPA: SDR family NAD(P)-dependent oxidoreductase [Sphingobium sp.]|nr:SDR family NAD(P)-dependent oxidoreductase [Sphingobium sp.]